jgi:UPF0716 protein FxsA
MNPLFPVLLIFVVAPLTELYFLIEVGSHIGGVATIALTVFTAVLGGLLVRLQGLSVLLRVREMTERGEVPAIEMLEGAVLMLAGVLLLLPGFITDAIGFLLLITPLRRMLILGWLRRRGVMHPARREGGSGEKDAAARKQRQIIDGEFHRED